MPKKDWPIHKLLCSTVQEFADDKRPDSTFISGMFFSETEVQPRLVWLQKDKQANGGNTVKVAPPMKPGDFRTICFGKGFQESPVLHHPLDKHILNGFSQILVGNGQMAGIGALNKSLFKVDKELGENFIGPIITFGRTIDEDRLRTEPIDLDIGDFRHIMDKLRTDYDAELRKCVVTTSVQGVPAIRVNCLGERRVFKCPHFEEVRMMAEKFRADENPGNFASHRIGIPLLLAKIQPGLSWRKREFDGVPANYNIEYSYLQLCFFSTEIDLKGQLSEKQIHDRVAGHGTFVVMRKDKKPLHAFHLQAIAQYLHEKLRAYRQNAENDKFFRLADFLGLISKKDFLTHYGEWIEMNMNAHPELASLPLPYEV